MIDRENWTVVIRDNSTGETAEYVDAYGCSDENPFIYEDGNYSCDCNRSLFFQRAKGVPGEVVQSTMSECGDKAFTVLAIRRPNGKVIYSEVDDVRPLKTRIAELEAIEQSHRKLNGELQVKLAAAEVDLVEKQQEIDTLTGEVDCHSAEEDGWEHDLKQERALREAAEQRAATAEKERDEAVMKRRKAVAMREEFEAKATAEKQRVATAEKERDQLQYNLGYAAGYSDGQGQIQTIVEAEKQRADGLEAQVAGLVKFVEDFNAQFVCWGMMTTCEENGAVKDFVERASTLLSALPDSARRVAAVRPAKLVYMATDTDDKTLSTLKLHFDARVTDELRAFVLTALNDAALTREGDGK